MSVRANVDFPAPDGPITPTACPGSTVKLIDLSAACFSPGATTVSALATSRALGCGSAVRGGSSLTAPRSCARLAQPDRPRCTTGHWFNASSTGASARPSRIEPAIIAPGVIWFFKTNHAPSPSMADCRNNRSVLVIAVNVPPTSVDLTCCSNA